MIYAYKGSYTVTNCYRNIFSNKKKVQHIIENDYKRLQTFICKNSPVDSNRKPIQRSSGRKKSKNITGIMG